MARYSKGKYHVLLNEYTYENGHGFDYHLKINRDFLIALEGGDNSSK